jgi:pimeloyl-ACP methyl ester carboxylesterase
MKRTSEAATEATVRIPSGAVWLEGNLAIPEEVSGIVLFAHGSGSSRHSPRNHFVAEVLQGGGLGTLLFDLLSSREEAVDLETTHLRFDIAFLAERLLDAIDWVSRLDQTQGLKIGLFGSSTGAGAALVAAAQRPDLIGAVVSRGGRPDLAGSALERVVAPTLLIVGGNDVPVITLNRQAQARLRCVTQLEIIPRATHLFEEPGALEQVAGLARDWFSEYL